MKTLTCFRSKTPRVLLFTLFFIFFFSNLNAQISQWTSRGNGAGGALFSPSFSPHNANEIYMGCDMSELFHTTDLGNTWNEVDFRQMVGNNGAKVQFTNNPLIMYCTNFESDLMTPHKSTDGGVTWNPLASDPTFGEAFSFFGDINNSNNLLITDYTTLYYSSNGGTSFTQKYNNPAGCYVAGVLFDGSNVYVGLDNGVLVSTNSGSSFSISAIGGIPGTESIVSFAGAKEGGVVRFLCVTLGNGDVYPGVTGADHYGYKNIYSIDWGQANWSLKISGINSTHHPFFIAMAKNNISVAYTGGGSEAGDPTIYKTTNGGSNWTNVFLTNNNQNIFTGWSGHGGDRGWSYGEYALGFDCSPVDPDKVIITDLGFPHITTNGGTTWKQAYLNTSDQNPMNLPTPVGKYYHGIGLENTSCWWLTWSDAMNITAGYSDIKGTRSTDGGNTWSFNYTGNTYNSMYQSHKHPVTGNLYAAVSSVHDMYQSTYLQDSRINSGTGKILFSTNNGAAWLTLHDFVHPVISIAFDPNSPNTMYASVIHSTLGGIFLSTNIQNGASSTWTKLTNPPRTEGHPFNIKVLNDGTLLCSYSGRRNPAGAFTSSSGIFISTNSGTSWIDRSAPGMLYWTKDIVVDAHDVNQNTWYGCVFSGWGGPPNGLGGLYKTTNRGVNWTRINSLDRVGSCTISPVNPNEMYMTTEVDGLWYSSNINSGTPAFTQVQSYKFRQPERIFYNPFNTNEVWITSFGNGIKVGYTNPPSLSLNVTLAIEGMWNGTTEVQDTIRFYLRSSIAPYNRVDSAAAYLNSSGNATVNFINAAAGNYYLQTSHRNALETWSSGPVSFTAGVTTSYNFTTSQTQAFGNNLVLKSGKWCIYSGDIDKSGVIQLSDIISIYNDASNFVSGYVITDLTGENLVNLTDILIAANNSSNFVGVIKP
ncbi:MAG: hypothetical protein ABI462_00780 [Ignavibacteria bacterium]